MNADSKVVWDAVVEELHDDIVWLRMLAEGQVQEEFGEFQRSLFPDSIDLRPGRYLKVTASASGVEIEDATPPPRDPSEARKWAEGVREAWLGLSPSPVDEGNPDR